MQSAIIGQLFFNSLSLGTKICPMVGWVLGYVSEMWNPNLQHPKTKYRRIIQIMRFASELLKSGDHLVGHLG